MIIIQIISLLMLTSCGVLMNPFVIEVAEEVVEDVAEEVVAHEKAKTK